MDINTDLNGLESTGKKVVSNGNTFLEEAKKIESYLEELKNAWQGEDNQSYVATISNRIPDIKNLGNVILDFGNFMISSSKYLLKVQEDIKNRGTRL